jgi:hypothetical protein
MTTHSRGCGPIHGSILLGAAALETSEHQLRISDRIDIAARSANVSAPAGRLLRYTKYFDGIATAAEGDRSHGLNVEVGVITHRL